ncbi:hydroxyisourate hydrolase [Alloalcanivorax xenomutans]|uniref:hydroxyisourate hydrolase n=1 Tax=Alloalcanivorax xenomutans TaxID=1094342 RepID=UPI001F252F37|nr:hydroxyisourate hydrolase [Alloalcanivorax xenomutans]MCE7524521.1 hydroxyisourate hydrolase [Alloalcanivorax xenomutans]
MGRLTTHVLDTSSGRPAADLSLQLWRIEGSQARLLTECKTNADGRCDTPLLEGVTMISGVYQLCFAVGDYFLARGISLPTPSFLDDVVIRFGISAPDQHYHVPLLVSPYGYSTYRGS